MKLKADLLEDNEIMREALEAIAATHKPGMASVTYWTNLGVPYDLAEMMANDVEIARGALRAIKP